MSLFHRNKIGRASIKESFDNLPCGICFIDKNGLIVLCNKQMYRLCHTLLGRDLQYISELQDAMNHPQNGVKTVSADTDVFHFPSGEVWKFTKSDITDADGNAYTQIQAFDVTALYETEKELKRENAQLSHTYHTSYNLDDIRNKAERIGMVEAENAECFTVFFSLPKEEEEPTAWDDFLWLLSGLFSGAKRN